MTQFTITELSNNKDYKRIGSDPQISGKNVVWRIANPNENKIFLYDGNKTIEISSTNGTYPRISGDNIVWYGSDSEGDIEIFFYNGQETIQLTDNNVEEVYPLISGDNVVWCTDTTQGVNIFLDNGQDVIPVNEGNLANEFPKISGDNVVWSDQDFNGNKQIFLYNGKETIELSGNSKNNNGENFSSQLEGKKIIEKSQSSHGSEIFLNNINSKETIQLTRLISPIFDDIFAYYEPRIWISGDNVVWKSERGVFLYNGKKNIKLDDNVNISSVEMQGNNLVWTQTNFFDSQDDWEIFFYDGNETIQLTNNNLNDFSPQISGDNIVWQGGSGFDSEIFLYDGNEVIQLTDNNVEDLSPEIEGNKIVWERLNLEQDVPTTSVMMATLDDTDSSSLPTHREQQIINSSMVITLGLISIYLFKKLLLK